ncbi:MAG: hypothetical protein JNL50_04760 [Phycisphaerae bacterium]|nr:hypothetical protein [Phycisphaerae bacterium]
MISIPANSTTDTLGTGFDSFACAQRGSGRIWLGGDYLFSSARISYRDPGETTWTANGYSTIVAGSATPLDRPSMAIGNLPVELGGAPVLYMMFNGGAGSSTTQCDGSNVHWVSIADSLPPSSFWPAPVRMNPRDVAPNSGTCKYSGWANQPVVLDDGTVVVASTDWNNVYVNGKRPYVIRYQYDDDVPEDPKMSWWPYDGAGVRIGLNYNPEIQATQVHSATGTVGDTAFGIDNRTCNPSIAVDYSKSPNWVYVAFYARSAPGNPEAEPQDLNTDLYLALSKDGGVTFDNDDIFHITDEMLLGGSGNILATGPDQVMPAIAVDCAGGLSIVYYCNRNDFAGSYATGYYDVYYAHVTGMGGAPSIDLQQRFTGVSFPNGTHSSPMAFLGHYHYLAPAGPDGQTIYAAYIIREFDSTAQAWKRNCYVRRISARSCVADLNLNSEADPNDFDAFVDSYLDESPSADLNLDATIDGADVDLFVEAYDELGGGG